METTDEPEDPTTSSPVRPVLSYAPLDEAAEAVYRTEMRAGCWGNSLLMGAMTVSLIAQFFGSRSLVILGIIFLPQTVGLIFALIFAPRCIRLLTARRAVDSLGRLYIATASGAVLTVMAVALLVSQMP